MRARTRTTMEHAQSLIRALSCRPGPVSLSADDRMLAELRVRYENDESPRLRKTDRVFVESGITVIAVETENEDDGSDYGCGWVVASADSVGGTIGKLEPNSPPNRGGFDSLDSPAVIFDSFRGGQLTQVRDGVTADWF